jgi:flagellar basal body-associated protein FliL
MRDRNSDKKKIAKVFRIILICLAVLLLVYALLFSVLYFLRKGENNEKLSEDDFLSKSFRDYYEEDYDADIMKDEDFEKYSFSWLWLVFVCSADKL